jgi:hypothetical protein
MEVPGPKDDKMDYNDTKAAEKFIANIESWRAKRGEISAEQVSILKASLPHPPNHNISTHDAPIREALDELNLALGRVGMKLETPSASPVAKKSLDNLLMEAAG